ncbi:patatin-like phospholipase family protein [Roseococcus thiosulfatophilus]|uniref:patatin-like phospholipase family protein n=1 Tax=Roseococcus thiosulfatophilus TaxID=35813 RepID=UPI001A8FCD98|nr:patatin-like phospholipase family protein [Roseococcus thiosulfatophilus]
MSALPSPAALVLSGGVALGAFEAGACAALEASGQPMPRWIAGSSVGAVNAALFAAAPPGQGGAALRGFWSSLAQEPTPLTTFLLGPPPARGAWRAAHNRAAAWQTLLMGRPGLFRPDLRLGGGRAFYDMAPLRARLDATLDLDRLNRGPTRLSIVTTDVETGARVVFDTARGDWLTAEHILASSAMPGLFPPVELEGRRLVDGGLSANAPLDLILREVGEEALTCLVVELFHRTGQRPRRLSAALARAADLAFGNQTRQALVAHAREWEVRARMASLARHLPEDRRADPEVAQLLRAAGVGARATVVLMGYRAAFDEAGPGKAFDFSTATLADRWRAGEAAMAAALRRLTRPDRAEELAPGLHLHEVTAMPPQLEECSGMAAIR